MNISFFLFHLLFLPTFISKLSCLPSNRTLREGNVESPTIPDGPLLVRRPPYKLLHFSLVFPAHIDQSTYEYHHPSHVKLDRLLESNEHERQYTTLFSDIGEEFNEGGEMFPQVEDEFHKFEKDFFGKDLSKPRKCIDVCDDRFDQLDIKC
ncbi:hypothetical protein HOY82DRAFT_538530 [Tuber indicum]|nr:hypothetical protein HOY82DRAFT_538530 [Tuber indicum]